jgi:hypothetical protein
MRFLPLKQGKKWPKLRYFLHLAPAFVMPADPTPAGNNQ